MERDTVLRILRDHHDELVELKVKRLQLFGSVARNEAGPESDVDLLVEFSQPVGYFHLFGVQRRIEELLGTSVDLVPEDGLKPRLRDRILKEAVPAG